MYIIRVKNKKKRGMEPQAGWPDAVETRTKFRACEPVPSLVTDPEPGLTPLGHP
jgi:hypothetical protein